MSFDIDDLPTIEEARKLGRHLSADSPLAGLYVAPPESGPGWFESVGVTTALQLVSRFQQQFTPSAMQLSALHTMAPSPSYTMYSDCAGYNYDGTCNEACFGFAPHHMDPYYCATCAEQAANPTQNPAYNWHFVGARGALQYWDREPDVCNGRDAWKWKVGACGNCSTSAVFRCHDGYKRYANGTVEPTICQGLVACNDQLTPCP
jgi:hypothetical protein